MTDTIHGSVTTVIDGDTFDITVTHTGKENKTKYNNEERIRIAEIDVPELNTVAGKRSKDALKRKLKVKEVRYYIQARDTYSRLVAKVTIL